MNTEHFPEQPATARDVWFARMGCVAALRWGGHSAAFANRFVEIHYPDPPRPTVRRATLSDGCVIQHAPPDGLRIVANRSSARLEPMDYARIAWVCGAAIAPPPGCVEGDA